MCRTDSSPRAEHRTILFELFGPGTSLCLIESNTNDEHKMLKALNERCQSMGMNPVYRAGEAMINFFERVAYVLIIGAPLVSYQPSTATSNAISTLEAIRSGCETTKYRGTPSMLAEMRHSFAQSGHAVIASGIEYVPKETISLQTQQAEKLKQAIAAVENEEMIIDVYTNATPT